MKTDTGAFSGCDISKTTITRGLELSGSLHRTTVSRFKEY
jgi:hypothetical protein